MLFTSLRDAEATLEAAGVASPRNDAQILAAHLLRCTPMELGLRMREPTPDQFEALVARRAQREPLQHIVGEAWFGPLTLKVGPGVFIPRPETEVLADWAVQQLSGGENVVDLCTGSGALAAYVATLVPTARVTAVELSPAAARYAQQNLPTNVNLVIGDATDSGLLRSLAGTVDVVVSNPPYVPETPDLAPEVYHDPAMAVFSGEDGMDAIKLLIPVIHELLVPNGRVGIEHDDATSLAVLQEFHKHGGFGEIAVLEDLTGRNRFVKASKLP
ncbi:peptide chain release factor N(5)-glutamine methyltransferase [Corynebacterium ulcerans]|uniref:peptide chain release factor N(5)-glutamine methyltransferase n=1 Tax=Corynebacterium ulcerans TaxID=65058 RepID=UPI00148F1566|nr:peptide chain release factor N(5)-glutamine methyltransferase [Corynebacterium ulcerans]NOM02422.1 peptide chain release factor N(5)-glutamine methyltransferase [Corynebacterium ulcerans]